MHPIKLITYTVFAFALTSCAATFVDKSLTSESANDVAILEHADPVHGGIVIEKIDGKWRGNGIINEYKLAPGAHTIGVLVNRAFYASGQVNRKFDVLAGHRYLIEGFTDEKNLKWGFRIIDKATNTQVDTEI